jgi:3-oxoacyl-[acyl-carrier protein] reductase
MDRITLAAAREFAHLRITANVINPGATDTGWMDEEQMAANARDVPLGRVSTPGDCSNLVSFLCDSVPSSGGNCHRRLLPSYAVLALSSAVASSFSWVSLRIDVSLK